MIGFRASPGPRPSASHPASDSGKTPHLTPAASLHHEEGNEEKKKNGPTEAVTMDSRARRLQGLVQGPTGFAYSTSSPKLTTPLVNPSDDRVKVAGKSYMLEKLPALPEDKRGSASTAVPNLLKIDEITSSQLIDDYIVYVHFSTVDLSLSYPIFPTLPQRPISSTVVSHILLFLCLCPLLVSPLGLSIGACCTLFG